MFRAKRILVPLSFDRDEDRGMAETALDAAVVMARAFGAELVLYHVSPSPAAIPAVGMDMTGYAYESLAELCEAQKQKAEKTIQDWVNKIRGKGISISWKVVEMENTLVDMITREADEDQVDMVILCTRGQGGVKHFFFGSVAERLVHSCKKPVLVLHEQPFIG